MENSSSTTSNDKNKLWNLFHYSTANSSSSSSSPSSSPSPSSKWNKFLAMKASLMLLFFFISTLVLTQWSSITTMGGSSLQFTLTTTKNNQKQTLKCKSSNMTLTCPSTHPSPPPNTTTKPETCPEYFRHIHEDLSTWSEGGITRRMVESLRDVAHFRVVIIKGRAYVKQYQKAYQTRDVYTLWGILQMMKLYPGKIPDVDFMFQCHDYASIKKNKYQGFKSGFGVAPPPQFHYCGDDSTYDIVFPDWSFWGWPELNIKPWVPLAKDLEGGNAIRNWSSREPFAFWKGNSYTGRRKKLRNCNSIKDWSAQIVEQNWRKEIRGGFRNSDLSKQCNHRYKIYMEGNAWSVSEKYILACDSMTLLVNPNYYDFFTRSLIPMKHYWPINPNNICNSIKFAVDWGNNNTLKAQEMGRAGSEYIFNQIKIEHVYDYMFHVLNEYSKLLTYTPTVPEGAEELCSERFACSPPGLLTNYKTETMVSGPSDKDPCVLPPPFERDTLRTLREQDAKIKEVVAMWEKGH